MKPFAAIKKVANEAAFSRSYSAMLMGYPVIKIGEIGAGYFPSKQSFVIVSKVTYFGNLGSGMVPVLRLE